MKSEEIVENFETFEIQVKATEILEWSSKFSCKLLYLQNNSFYIVSFTESLMDVCFTY